MKHFPMTDTHSALPPADKLRLAKDGAYALSLDDEGKPALVWCFRDADFPFHGLATDLRAVRSTWVRGSLHLVAGRVYRLRTDPPPSAIPRSCAALRAGREDFRVPHVACGAGLPALSFDDPRWAKAPIVSVSRLPGSGGRAQTDPDAPRVRARIAADDQALYLLYDVQDEHGVQALGRKLNDWVYKDSTVEFFLRPEGELRYVNLEMNCIGTLYAAIVTDNRRDPARNNDLFDYRKATAADVRGIRLYPTLRSLPPNRKGLPGKTSWRLGAKIPFAALSRLFGHDVAPAAGTVWSVNFYKCADCSAKPFYLAWQDMPAVNFHDPDSFGTIRF